MRRALLLVLAAAASERVDRDADGVPDAAPEGACCECCYGCNLATNICGHGAGTTLEDIKENGCCEGFHLRYSIQPGPRISHSEFDAVLFISEGECAHKEAGRWNRFGCPHYLGAPPVWDTSEDDDDGGDGSLDRRTLIILFVVLGVVGAAVFLCVFGCVYAAFGKYLQAREAPFRSGAAPAPAASLMHKKRRAPSSSPRPTTPLAEDDDDSIDIELSPRYV